ncbi:MAG: BrnA antitoxin family protein [Methylocystis sp.]
MTRRAAKKLEITDAEIDAAVASDPDWAEFEPIDWSKAEVVIPPKKQAISIRLDQDLIDYFKAQGPGYQRRINAVLRSYVTERKTG